MSNLTKSIPADERKMLKRHSGVPLPYMQP